MSQIIRVTAPADTATKTTEKRDLNSIWASLGGTKGELAEDTDPTQPGRIKHGIPMQITRFLGFVLWFVFVCINICATQLLGAGLWFVNREYYYAYMAVTKQSFGIFVTTLCQWFSPTLVRVSWDAGMRGQFRKTRDGTLETRFPERLVLMPNHQCYTDWLYLWWIAYTSRMHGHVFIILKQSLKWVPMIGWGMQFFGFIFMTRKWSSDKTRLQEGLQTLKQRHHGPLSGQADLDPMWLLIFPEGTNLSANTRKESAAWAAKQGIPDRKHVVLPRSTGLLFCLKELNGTVDWIYDVTVHYTGTPIDGYASDYFTLRSTFLQGRPPKAVNMYWRRFAIADIPLNDKDVFDQWVQDRWKEKDALLTQCKQTGFFPADQSAAGDKGVTNEGYIDTEVKIRSPIDLIQIFAVPAALLLILNVVSRLRQMWS